MRHNLSQQERKVTNDCSNSFLYDDKVTFSSCNSNTPFEQNSPAMRRKKKDNPAAFCPNGRFLYFWSALISCVCLYNMWAIFFRYAFYEIKLETIIIWFPIDYTADILYIIDIIVGLRTAFLENGIIQKDARKTRQHYLNSTRFYIDCLSLLPLDLLYLSLGFHSLLRIFRIVKIYKMGDFIDRSERQIHWYSSLFFSAVKGIVFNLTWLHWNACLYRCVMDALGFTDGLIYASTVNATHMSVLSPIENYFTSFYCSLLSLTLLHPAPPPTATKLIFGFFILEAVVGFSMLAILLGNVHMLITINNSAHNEFLGHLSEVKRYLLTQKAPERLEKKLIGWFDYLWRQSHIANQTKVLAYMPDRLRAEIAIHMHLDSLKKVDMFQDTEEGFLSELVLHLRLALFCPGDFICRKGEIGREMFFVSQGQLEILAPDDFSILVTLGPGAYFGEISILNLGNVEGNRRTASVRSKGYSDLFCLSKEDLWDVLKDYPMAKEKLEQVAFERLNACKEYSMQLTSDELRDVRPKSASTMPGRYAASTQCNGRQDGSSFSRSPLHHKFSLQCSYGESLESAAGYLPPLSSRKFYSASQQQFGDRLVHAPSFKRFSSHSSYDFLNEKLRGSSRLVQKNSEGMRTPKQYFFDSSFQEEEVELVIEKTKRSPPIPQIRFERAATPEPLRFYIPETNNQENNSDGMETEKPEIQQQLQLPLTENTSYASSSLSLQSGSSPRDFESPQANQLNNQLLELQHRVSSLESENRLLSIYLLQKIRKQFSEETVEAQTTTPDSGNEISEHEPANRYRKRGFVSMDGAPPPLLKSIACTPLLCSSSLPTKPKIREGLQD